MRQSTKQLILAFTLVGLLAFAGIKGSGGVAPFWAQLTGNSDSLVGCRRSTMPSLSAATAFT